MGMGHPGIDCCCCYSVTNFNCCNKLPHEHNQPQYTIWRHEPQQRDSTQGLGWYGSHIETRWNGNKTDSLQNVLVKYSLSRDTGSGSPVPVYVPRLHIQVITTRAKFGALSTLLSENLMDSRFGEERGNKTRSLLLLLLLLLCSTIDQP